MKTRVRALGALLFLVSYPQAGAQAARFTEEVDAKVFYRGNIHTHSSKSDGDVAPSLVAKRYKDEGYDWLSITDHDLLTILPERQRHGLVMVNGVELTGTAASRSFGGTTKKKSLPVHVNAICGRSGLKGVRKPVPAAEILNRQIDRARADGAVVLVNHPNFRWALKLKDLLAAHDFDLLEIASGHSGVRDGGDPKQPLTRPSAEKLWDQYLTQKKQVFGAAVDDSHYFAKRGESEPARAWVQVWAPKLDAQNVCEALRAGHFYSSRGSKLTFLKIDGDELELAVDGWQNGVDRIEFIGAGGEVLATSHESPAHYELRGTERYVRARIYQAGGREAWTQAYFVGAE